jgi:hypothetical protein
MQPDPAKSAELSADEWIVILAYRQCDDRRQEVIRLFANSLAGQDEQPGEVIPFPQVVNKDPPPL